MKKTTSVISAFLFFTGTCLAQAIPTPVDPQLKVGKLSNGLTYYIRNNNKPKGRADFYLVQKVGSVLEEENQRGLAHFLEHMAFNGTKNFPGNTLISELEKKGIKFGTNINASTSYDQTIYKLINIPLREGIVDTALLVLHDWSGFITNNEQDIEEERGVIREEWRTRSTGNLRVLEKEVFPVIYAGTPYANRIPIGSIDVINHFKPHELRDYYKKWYRPDLQGIIVVGDINVSQIEVKIKQLFSGIPAPVNLADRNYSQIPDNPSPIVVVASDPELSNTSIKVHWKLNDYPSEQVAGASYYKYKMSMINRMIGSMFMSRFAELRQKADQPFRNLSAGIDDFEITPIKKALTLQVEPMNDGGLIKSLELALLESERLRRFGFTASELETYIKSGLRLMEREYIDRNNKENFEYVKEYMQHFLQNEPAPGIEWKYNTAKKILSELSLDTLNYWAKQYVKNDNMVIIITHPQKQDAVPPAKQEILAIWENVQKTKLEPYVPPVKINELSTIKPVPGKVVKTEQKPFGYTQWTLSNGAKVRFKNTGYEEDKLYIYGYSPGGHSQVEMEELPSALAINEMVSRGSGTGGVDGRASVTTSVQNYYEYITGVGSVKDIAILLQLTYLKMTSLKKEQAVFDSYISSNKEQIRDRTPEPKIVFRDTLTSIMSNRHPRAISLNDSTVLDQVSYDKIIRLYKESFADASDFTFFITGNIDADSVRLLVEKYLGGLPTLHSKERMKDHGMHPPKGMVKNHFTQKMKTPQSTVTIGYTGELALTIKNQVLMACLSNILRTVYLQSMREKEGGTYGADVSGGINKFPQESFLFQINFDTDPLKKEKLINITYEEIRKIIAKVPPRESLEKVKANLLKNHREQSGEKNAEYWARTATTKFVYGIDGRNFEKVVSSITPEMVRQFAKKLFSHGNIIEVVMNPEK